MKIVLLPELEESFVWFNQYYAEVFPEGGARGVASLNQVFNTLKLFPESGTIIHKITQARTFHLFKTPFSILYFVEENYILILAILDTRANNDIDKLIKDYFKL